MELSIVVLKQTLTMAIYMAMGFLLFKTGKITKEGSKSMAAILLWLVIPAVIVDSFCIDFSVEKLMQLGVSTLLGALALIVAMIFARLVYRKLAVEQFAAAFSNVGFMGIPLVKASLGDEAVFFLVGFVALLNLLQWTYGASLLQKEKKAFDLKGILLNPIFLALFLGIALFVSGLGAQLPGIPRTVIKGISALNAPLAMVVLGVYLAQTDLRAMFLSRRLYWLSIVRLGLIPLATALLLWLLPVDSSIKLTILIGASTPVGSNVAVYAQIYDADYSYACQTVALSTVLSVLTLPLIIGIGHILLF